MLGALNALFFAINTIDVVYLWQRAAPPAGVLAYSLLERAHPGTGRYALLLPMAMTLAGAIGFKRMQLSRTGTSTT